MASRVYPSAGVYTQENDMSARATAAATSIVGAVGEASRGPVGVITDVFDTTDLHTRFGFPNSQKYGFGLYCAGAALAETRQLKYVRVVSQDALTAGAYLTVDNLENPIPNARLTVFDDGANNPRGVYDPLNNLGFTLEDEAGLHTMAYFCAVDPGKWNDEIAVRIRPANPSGVALSDEHNYNPYHFWVDVFINYRNSSSRPVESFKVSREYELDGDGTQMYIEDAINRYSNYIRVKNNPHCGPIKIKKEAFEFFSGGADGSRPTEAQIVEAWQLFADPEVVDVNLLMNCGYTTPNVQRAMLVLAERRADCLAVLDLPDSERDAARAVNYVTNELNYGTSYGAIYTPYLQIRDTHNDKSIFIPPSGHICGAMAYTDRVRAAWFAPAGLARGTLKVLDIAVKYKQGARDSLDRAHINPIRNIPGRGFVIMGQETLQHFASAFSNINVRRLVNLVKKSIANAATVSNFDPNDSVTRRSLVNICDNFLRPIKGGRGLYDFQTVCDERNNKPVDMANGDLNLDVYMDPTIPAKRIHLNTNIMPTGTYFDEN